MPKPRGRPRTAAGRAACGNIRPTGRSRPIRRRCPTARADEQQGESHVHHDHVGQRGAAHFAALGRRTGISRNDATVIAPRKRETKIRLRRSLRPAWRRTSSPARCSAARWWAGICVRGNARDIPRVEHRATGPRPRRSARTAPKEVHRASVASEEEGRRSPTTVRYVRRQALRRPLPSPERPRRDDCQRRPHLGLERGGEYQRPITTASARS